MMNRRIIIDKVKHSKLLYNIYYYIGSGVLRIAGLFIKSDSKEILFVCYGGRKYGDNIRPIYLNMLSDERFNDWKFTWAFKNINEFELPDNLRTKKIKIDTPSFYFHALKSKCWITNVSVQRGLNFKNKGTLYVNTWHGVPIKLIRCCSKDGFNIKNREDFDLIFTEGSYDADISIRAFEVSPDKIKTTGYSRNDIMFDKGKELSEKVREKYKLSGKKVVLYAPTYRDYNTNDQGGYTFEKKISSFEFKKALGSEYVLMVRAHGAIEDNSSDVDSYIDVTDYPDVEDLLVTADILITDYSGIMFDYSLLEKPIICFLYDLEKYKEKRGLFVDIESFVPFEKCYTEQEVYNAIKKIDQTVAIEQCKSFKLQCGLIENGATQNAVDEIFKAIHNLA